MPAGQRGLGDDQPVHSVPVQDEVTAKGLGEQPRDRVRSMVGGLLHAGNQVGPLGVQPPQRLDMVVEPRCRLPVSCGLRGMQGFRVE